MPLGVMTLENVPLPCFLVLLCTFSLHLYHTHPVLPPRKVVWSSVRLVLQEDVSLPQDIC